MPGNSKLFLLMIFLSWTVWAGESVYNNPTAPPGKLYDVGNYRLHLYCTGTGSPAVILDAGIGGFSLDWSGVQRRLPEHVRVCSYDRAGYGWSDSGPSPRSTSHIVDELHTLLQVAEVLPPYVLVGHSFGGYNMLYLAKTHPDESAGLVLVDSSHPDQAERLPELPAVRDRNKNNDVVTFYQGQSNFKYYPKDIQSKLMWALAQQKMIRTVRRESANFVFSGEQVKNAGTLPDIPLIVITRGKRVWPDEPYGNMLETTWSDMQKELAGLTPKGRQIIAAESDHLIHLEQPEVIAAAIISVIQQVQQHLPDYE